MPRIIDIKARQVFDSRGLPTVEADVILDKGFGRFITPSGASVGKHEALELRDHDRKHFHGRGVLKAVANIHGEIRERLINKNFTDQCDVDDALIKLDGSKNKSRLGANAILAVSGAFFHALADHVRMPLYACKRSAGSFIMPLPLVNVINGGVHANNGLDVQEFMLVPSGADSFSLAMNMVAESFYALKSLIKEKGMSVAVGDEGGFAPSIRSNEEALDLLMAAITKAGLHPEKDIKLALDVAASELYDEESRRYRLNGKLITDDEFLAWYQKLIHYYPICSIEDPFSEDDRDGFIKMVSLLGQKLQIVGDDLFVTNIDYIREGIEHHWANAVLIKMNQIGTVTETLEAVDMTQSADLRAIISHRSGDSEDITIADLSVLTSAGQIKTGSLSRAERTAKYNRLLRIEEEVGGDGSFSPWCR